MRETAISASMTIMDVMDNYKKKELPFEARERMICEIGEFFFFLFYVLSGCLA